MLAVINVICYLINGVLLIFSVYFGKREKKLRTFLKDEERYFGEVVKEYAKSDSLSTAVAESADETRGDMRKEAMKLAQALESDADSDEANFYIKNSANSYMALFYLLCNLIRSYGDLRYEGVSLFSHNVRYIKEELRQEILRRQDGEFLFLGLSGLAIIPFFFMTPLELWAKSVGDGMASYYSGTYGFMTLVLCISVTAGTALLIWFLQYERRGSLREKSLCQKILRVAAVERFVEWIIARRYGYYLKMNEKLKSLETGENVRIFLVKKYVGMVAGFLLAVLFVILFVFFNGRINAGIFLLTMACFGAIGFFMPDMRLIVLNDSASGKKMEETLRFETLILIGMHYEQMTVEELLRWMERFSVVFRNSFERAADDFSYARETTLNRLRDEVAYEPAMRLIDGLVACDDIPLEKAFYDLEGERAYNMDQYVNMCASRQRERAAAARLIAFLPFVTILAFRLVVPFVAEGLTRLSGM